MAKKTVRLIKRRWLPSIGDKTELVIRYEVIDSELIGKPQAVSQTQYGKVIIGVSRTLQAMWGLEGRNLEMVLVEYAKQHIRDRLQDNVLSDEEELQLSSSNASPRSPFYVRPEDYYFPTGFEVDVAGEAYPQEAIMHTLAAKIIDLRDNANAVFGERVGGCLLTLLQERALAELSRQCDSEEEFAYRVTSLCALATAIDTSNLGTSSEGPAQGGSIDRLGVFLRREFPESDTSKIMDTLSHFNRLRRMYPVHTDRATGVIRAFEFFGLEYPVREFQRAWEKLLKAYLEVLRSILDLLGDA